jgi:putative Ca2+/H+ antiporter (TMEM165/GDT1 family)
VSLAVALTVFALILPAELPDKTMVATLVLATRYPALPVWLGVTTGFAVQSVVAVAAGGLVSLLPSTVVHGVTAGMFAIGAVVLLREKDTDLVEEEREITAELADEPPQPSFRRAMLTSFGVLFAAEWGDLSQILTANFAAKYGDPVAVFIGAWLALATVAGMAVLGGRALLRVVPLLWVRRLAAALFATMATVTALEAAGAFG